MANNSNQLLTKNISTMYSIKVGKWLIYKCTVGCSNILLHQQVFNSVAAVLRVTEDLNYGASFLNGYSSFRWL